MSLLHLIDPDDPAGCGTSLAWLADLLSQAPSDGSKVCVLGEPDSVACARRLGLRADDRCPAPSWKNPAALWQLRSMLKQPPSQTVHTLSLSAAKWALRLAPQQRRIVTLAQVPADPAASWALRRLIHDPRTRFAALQEETHDWLVGRGVALERLERLPLAIRPRRTGDTDRAAIRESWGLTDPRIKVVVVLADPPASIEALHALFDVGLVSVAGRNVRLVMSPRAHAMQRAWHVQQTAGREPIMILDSRVEEPWTLLFACDAALVMNDGLSLLWAMSAGLPIVAFDTPALRRRLEDHHTALLAPPDSFGQVARRICQLLDNPELAARLGQTARQKFEKENNSRDAAAAWERIVPAS